MGEESKNCTSFRMCLNLNDYQFKTSRYSYRSTYVNSMVTANQKHTIDKQKTERKEPKYNTKDSHQTTEEETKKRTENNYKDKLKPNKQRQ